jgi:Rho-binding antiterminator
VSEDSYQPIDCTLHDRIEAHASLRKTVRIVYREGDRVLQIDDRIIDWFAKDGAEYMRVAGGPVIRLDHVRSIDDVIFSQGV